jgi:thiol-disulfide isomerase/thioredoxin
VFGCYGTLWQNRTLKSLFELSEPQLLLFIDPNCGLCTALMPDIAHWQKEYANTLTAVPISQSDRTANKAKAKKFSVKNILLQKKRYKETV